MARNVFVSLGAAFILLAASPAFAQHTHQVVDGVKVSKPWGDVVGRRVVVEGLAWGAAEKGLGQRVILAEGQVYVENVDYLRHKANGRLVRITGTLRKERMKAAAPDAQGYGANFDYFVIETDEWRLVDQVTNPWMQEIIEPAPRAKQSATSSR
jgi:hypothetical protein